MLSLAAADLLSALLVGISPTDSVTILAVGLVLLLASVLASYLPARRAASLSPVDILRRQ